MRKRLLSILLIIVMLVTCLPAEAICEAEERLILSAAEQQAILSLTGMQDGAAQWHVGMEPTGGMSAGQLLSWVQWFTAKQFGGVQENYRLVSVHAEKWMDALAASDPEKHAELLPYYLGSALPGDDAPYEAVGLYALAQHQRSLMILLAELQYAETALSSECEDIVSVSASISQKEAGNIDRIVGSQRLLKDRAKLNDAMANVLSNWSRWESETNRHASWLNMGLPGFLDPAVTTAGNDGSRLGTDKTSGVVSAPLTVSMLRGARDEHSLISRLGTSGYAPADKEVGSFTVINGDQYVVCVQDKFGKPISGAKVVVSDLNGSNQIKTLATDVRGQAIFDFYDFHYDSDENAYDFKLEVTALDYREQKYAHVSVARGQMTNIYLEQDDGSPYIYAITFDQWDVLYNQEKYYFDKTSEKEKTFTVELACPGERNCHVTMNYLDPDGVEQHVDREVSLTNGKGEAVFSDTWLSKLKPGALISFKLNTSKKEYSKDSMLTILPPVLVTEAGVDQLTKWIGGNGFGFTFEIPDSVSLLKGSSISLNIPFQDYYPKVFFNPDGSLVAVIGRVNLPSPDPWENKNAKAISKITKAAEKKGIAEKKAADIEAQATAMQQKGVSAFGKLNVALALVLTGKISETSRAAKVTIDGSIFLSLKGSITWYPAPLFYLSANGEFAVGAGITLGAVADYSPEKGSLTNFRWDFEPPFFHLRLMLMVRITVSAGAGAQGVASISINGSGYLNIMFHVVGTGLKITVGGSIYAAVELLFVTWRFDIYKFPDKVLWDTMPEQPDRSLPRQRQALSGAQANADDSPSRDIPLSRISSTMHAVSADLITSVKAGTPNLQLVTVDDGYFTHDHQDTLVFYLSDKGKLCYADLTNNVTGDIHSAFVVYESSYSTLGTRWEKVEDFQDALVYDYRVMSSGDMIFIGVLAADKMKTVTTTLEDGTVQTRTVPDTENGNIHAFTVEMHDSDGSISLGAPAEINVGGQAHGYRKLTDGPAWYISGQTIDFTSQTRSQGVMTIQREDGQANPWVIQRSGSYALTEETVTPGNIRAMILKGYGGENGTARNWYALEKPADSSLADQTQLVAYNNTTPMDSESVIDTGRITTFCLLSGQPQPRAGATGVMDQYDYIAYIKEDDNLGGTGKAWHMMGAKMHHKADRNGWMTLEDIERIDYGVELTTPAFTCQTIRGVNYLYWIETTADENYRLRAVTWDPESGIASSPYALAELKLEDDVIPSSVILTPEGKGYFSASHTRTSQQGSLTMDIRSFDLQMVKSITPGGAILDEVIATPGHQLDMKFTLQNTGNVPVAAVTVAVMVRPAGDTGEGRKVQEITYDFAQPEASKNVLVLNSEPSTLMTGPAAVDRIHASLEGVNSSRWVQKRTTWKPVTDGSGAAPVMTENASWVETDLLMPGDFATLKSFLLVDNSWNGTYEIYLKLVSVQATKDFIVSPVSNGRTVRSPEDDDIVDGSDYSAISLIDTSLDDLTVDAHCQYVDGSPYLTITITNFAAADHHSDHQSVTMVITTDDGSEVVSYPLPIVNGNGVHFQQAYNLDIRLDQLLDVKSVRYLDISVTGSDWDTDYEEFGDADNHMRVYLNAANDPVIVQQPQDTLVRQGESASFSVLVEGGVMPYTYQWEYSEDNGRSWIVQTGMTGATATLQNTAAAMNGRLYRCVITDANMTRVTSEAAKLTVMPLVPETGDATDLPLLTGLLLVSLVLLSVLVQKRRKGSL